MRFILPALLALLVSLPAASESSLGARFDKAEAYLGEVFNHLSKSYIERDRVKEDRLLEACRDGFRKALEDEAIRGSDKAVREAILAAADDDQAASIEALLRRVGKAARKAKAEEFDVVRLADAAAASMVQSIEDPFSNLLRSEDMQKLMRQMQGEGKTDSLGIGLEPGEKSFKVSFVMYGYAAYDAGLKIGDEITEVDGTKIAGKALKEVQPLFAVKEGDSIVLTVRREGWNRAYDIGITNSPRKIRNVHTSMLPGGIGYIRLTIFDLALGSATLDGLKSLKKDGMKALILDLRNNPGGALPAAISVADTFIAGKKLITFTESNLDMAKVMPFTVPGITDQGGEVEYRAKKESDFEQMPMVCLVNESSASASEMLSGALQDLGRAVIVGEKTYGKGVGQTAIPLWKTQGKEFGKALIPMLPNRFLYLTVMRYALPSGRSIHHEGVVPDITVKLSQPSGEAWDAIFRLRKGGKVRAYAAEMAKDLAKKLAVYDGFDTASYPGFGKLYASLKTDLTEDEVRAEIRRELRLRIGGKTALVDMQTDPQIQRAFAILADKLGLGK
jgi:carboxyl-terminal processing protease